MYIYSDLIESLVVGDVQANLLRTSVPRGQPGDMIAEETKIPTYHRLRTLYIFSALEINIRGDTGQLISVASGLVRVTLFRTATPFLKTTVKKVGKRMRDTGLDTGMQIAQDVLNTQLSRKAAKSRAKAAGNSFLTGALKDITQQGRGRKVLKRKRKAVPVSSRQIKKRRISTAKFRTIFDWWLQYIRFLFPVKTQAYSCSKYLSPMFLLWNIVKSQWVDYEPVQSDTNPIEFAIKPLSDYIDMNKSELKLVIKITKKMEETSHLERSIP